MQCIVVKSDEFENSSPLYISFKSWLCCCSLPSVAPQQLVRPSSIWLKVFFSGCGFEFSWFCSQQRWKLFQVRPMPSRQSEVTLFSYEFPPSPSKIIGSFFPFWSCTTYIGRSTCSITHYCKKCSVRLEKDKRKIASFRTIRLLIGQVIDR